MADFDYGHTCPDIDANIKEFKTTLTDHLDDVLSDSSPLLEGKPKDLYIENTIKLYYSQYEAIFEDLRRSNTDMRDAAEKQIADIGLERDNHEETISDQEDEIERLQNEITEAQEYEG